MPCPNCTCTRCAHSLSNRQGHVRQVLGSHEFDALHHLPSSLPIVSHLLRAELVLLPEFPALSARVQSSQPGLRLDQGQFHSLRVSMYSTIGKQAWESAGAPTGLPGQAQRTVNDYAPAALRSTNLSV